MMAEANAWVMIPKSGKKADEIVIDMRPLVLCKNCVFRDARDGMCEHVLQMRNPDWYCADGERAKDSQDKQVISKS